MAWVKAEDARTAAVLEKQKPFEELRDEALKVLDSPDKLPGPVFRGGMIYNKWQDKDHVRGIVRRTTLENYLTDDPKWETVIDYDALGRQDKQSWVGKGLDCLDPDQERCMDRCRCRERPEGQGCTASRPETEGAQAMTAKVAIYARVSTTNHGQDVVSKRGISGNSQRRAAGDSWTNTLTAL